MRQWAWVLLAILCVPKTPVRAQELQSAKFELASGFLIVAKGKVANVDGFRFIVDTGASRSVIDRKVAETFRLNREAGTILNFDRSIPVEWAVLPALSLGSLRVERPRVMVVDLARYSELGKGVDGIIGLDLLSKSKRFVIDYSAKNLYFELREYGSEPPTPSYFSVPINIQGIAMRVEVDTGVSEILLYRERLKKRAINLRYGEGKPVTIGRMKGTQVTLPGCKISGREQAVTVILIDGPSLGTLPTLDGYLAVAALHAKRIEFDFANMALRWQ